MALSTNVTLFAPPVIWHGRLGHPSFKIIKSLSNSGLLSFSSVMPSNFMCESCLCNKSQRLSFGHSTSTSTSPLELVYIDVWGPSSVSSVDSFYYYVIFVDHFTKYVWLYPLRLKSDVFSVFRQYKVLVEKFFKRPIVTVYSDGGGEYTALKSFLATKWIQHLKTPHQTP